MKNYLLIVALLAALACQLTAQPKFTPYTAGNPVIPRGPAGSWDAGLAFSPCMTVVNDTFYVCYSGSVSDPYTSPNQPMSIGLATSTDGFTFTKSVSNPILSADGSGFDAFSVESGTLYYDNVNWYLYYGGMAAPPSGIPSRIVSRAIAATPHGPWVRTYDTLLMGGSEGEWDDKVLAPLQILPTDSGLVMYYFGSDEWLPYAFTSQIGMATSTDGGQSWLKYDDPATAGSPYAESDPVIKAGPESYDILSIYGAGITRTNNLWEMFYSGSTVLSEASICYASSPDGIHWTKLSGNPIYTFREDPLSAYGVLEMPTVAINRFRYFLLYDYGVGPSAAGIGLATFPPGVQRMVPQDYATIQAAIDAALDGDTVLVDHGVYHENIAIENKSIVVASRLILTGDTSHVSATVIDGSKPVSPDSGSVVTITSCKDTTTELCGFTITGGTGTLRMPGGPNNPPYPLRIGGGILCWNSSARIQGNHVLDNNCLIDVPDGNATGAGIACAPPFTSNYVVIDGGNTVERNTAWAKGSASDWQVGWAQGGGIHTYCSGRMEGNRIVSNICRSDHGYAVGAGIRLALSGTTYVRDNDVFGNSSESYSWNAFAGGVSCSGANMVLDGNRITGNSVLSTGGSTGNGAGVYLDLGNDANWAVIVGNRIRANSSSGGTSLGGAIGMYTSSPEILNNIIDGNSATYGGAISAYEYSRPRLMNNTIVSNTASVGGAVYAAHSTIHPVILNTILWDNTASVTGNDIYVSSGASATVAHSNVEGGWTGAGNIDADPLFLDSTYRLSDPSPCIGAGVDSLQIGGVWYCAPDTCFYGSMRPNPDGSKPDIGACENPRANPFVEVGNLIGLIPTTFVLEQNYPNPFNPATTVRYGLPARAQVRLSVFNTLGQQVATLVQGQQEAGYHEAVFDASGLASGVYLYRLQAGEFVQTRKLVLLR